MSCNSGCIGRFDRDITIQERTDTNTYGRVVKTWSDWKTGLKAKIKTDSGTEKELSSKETDISKRVYIFRTKSITGITVEMKLIDDSLEFDIEHIGIVGREKYIEIIVKLRT